jgi:hypothetical protein
MERFEVSVQHQSFFSFWLVDSASSVSVSSAAAVPFFPAIDRERQPHLAAAAFFADFRRSSGVSAPFSAAAPRRPNSAITLEMSASVGRLATEPMIRDGRALGQVPEWY